MIHAQVLKDFGLGKHYRKMTMKVYEDMKKCIICFLISGLYIIFKSDQFVYILLYL